MHRWRQPGRGVQHVFGRRVLRPRSEVSDHGEAAAVAALLLLVLVHVCNRQLRAAAGDDGADKVWRAAAVSACTHTHTLTLLLFTLAFPDAMTSISSAAKSRSLQRSPLNRPGPGSTAHPGYGEGFHNISHSRHGERKTVVPPGLPVQGTSAAAALISGQGINLVWSGNHSSYLTTLLVPPPEPSSWHPRIAELYMPEKSLIFL
eukprot:353033-Chlamydomonas_euryale.AAC.15